MTMDNKITVKHALLFVLAMTLASGLWAQGFDRLPPGKWWENERLVEHIKLSPEQQKQINDMVYEHAIGLIDLNADLKRSELELTELVGRTELDTQAVRAAFAKFQKARLALESSHFEMLLSVRQILSLEQWQEMHQLRQRFERNRTDGGRPDRVGPGRDRPGGNRRPPGGR